MSNYFKKQFGEISILFCESDSIYKKLGCDVWDERRNALNFSDKKPAIYHPPCRLWSRLKGLSNADENEKYLAIWAVRNVQLNGGILEHPADSTLWKTCNLPAPGSTDHYGGFTIVIDQFHFGHKARKRTWLYIVGLKPNDKLLRYKTIPGAPKYWLGSNKRPGRKQAMPAREHSSTPIRFAKYLVKICVKINNSKIRNLNKKSEIRPGTSRQVNTGRSKNGPGLKEVA